MDDSQSPFIMVAPNGARRGKADHPALPITPDELAETARTCFKAGAGGIHLHVRDDEGAHSLDPGRYRAAVAAVSEAAPGMAIQITTESAGLFDVRTQYHCLRELMPPWASIAIRETARDPDLARHIYRHCAEVGTRVQHILYTPDCVARYRAFLADGTVPDGMREVLFVIGTYQPPRHAEPAMLDPFMAAVDALQLSWMLCAFGRHEHACLRHARSLGGDLRIGFENSLTNDQDQPWADNAASVDALVRSF